jgi:isopentenyl-diphosphate Delta-isomerase
MVNPTDMSLRKEDHLNLAARSQTNSDSRDQRFYYEPLLASHPDFSKLAALNFGPWDFHFPLWISSMTGGAEHASMINSRLATICEEFSLGMGLGSLRPLLEHRQARQDFAVKHLMPSRPLFGNLGVAQLEELLSQKKINLLHDVLGELKLDGLIIHVNPLQEWFQPQGDRYQRAAIETIEEFLGLVSYPVIVKEVGHGMGAESLKRLMGLNLLAIEFGAFGGTNFSLLENKRETQAFKEPFIFVGHSVDEMIGFVKSNQSQIKSKVRHFILSGGVKDSLTGFYYTQQLPSSLMGMAHSVLASARESEEKLREYISGQRELYAMAKSFLRVRGE